MSESAGTSKVRHKLEHNIVYTSKMWLYTFSYFSWYLNKQRHFYGSSFFNVWQLMWKMSSARQVEWVRTALEVISGTFCSFLSFSFFIYCFVLCSSYILFALFSSNVCHHSSFHFILFYFLFQSVLTFPFFFFHFISNKFCSYFCNFFTH